MDLIETFGAKIGALSEEKPQRARQLLTAGFRANGVKNKLASKRRSKSDRMLFQLVNRAMVTCLAKPQSNVMVSLFTPCEMLHLQMCIRDSLWWGCGGGGCTSILVPGLRPSQRKARNGPPTGWAGWGRGWIPFGKRRRVTFSVSRFLLPSTNHFSRPPEPVGGP